MRRTEQALNCSFRSGSGLDEFTEQHYRCTLTRLQPKAAHGNDETPAIK